MILLSHTLNIIIRSKRGKGYIVAWCHTCSQKKFAKEMKPFKNGLEILNKGPIIIVGLYLLGLKINTAHKTSGLCSHFFLISFHWGSHRLCYFCIFPFLSFPFISMSQINFQISSPAFTNEAAFTNCCGCKHDINPLLCFLLYRVTAIADHLNVGFALTHKEVSCILDLSNGKRFPCLHSQI